MSKALRIAIEEMQSPQFPSWLPYRTNSEVKHTPPPPPPCYAEFIELTRCFNAAKSNENSKDCISEFQKLLQCLYKQ